MRPPIVIVGASARAAAHSAMRAGFAPIALDLFADRDLSAVCRTIQIPSPDYAAHLPALMASIEPCPWIYTGALENWPHLVDELAAARPLLGICGQSLARLRNAQIWTDTLAQAGFDVLRVCDEVPTDDQLRWLVKPRKSGGGYGIRENAGESPNSDIYFQEYASGGAFGATFIARGSECELVGVAQAFTESRAGSDWIYAGGIAPAEISHAHTATLIRLGDTLASEFGLRGLFCVDFVCDEHGRIRPVEINPRYSASMELHEHTTGRALIAEHVRCFGIDPPDRPDFECSRFAAKRVLYADFPIVAPEAWPWHEDVADIPAPGVKINLDEPILTVFALGETRDETLSQLDASTAIWRERIESWRIRD